MTRCRVKNEMFFYGGSFVPLAVATHIPMKEWEDGMRQMRDIGFNAFRAFVAWNRIETKEGVRNFKELDYSLELAGKYGLNVTLNIGGIFDNLQGYRPPPWLAYKYHCQRRINDPRMVRDIGDCDLLLCNDDPVYHEKAGEFMSAVIKRYAEHPALECWAVWNEPAGNPCYCPCTLEMFRKWLQKRHGSLKALNDRWGTLFPLDFQTWEDVCPAFPDVMAAQTRQLDWLEFCEEHFIENVNWVTELVKSIDKIHPTSLNVMGVHARDFTKIKVDQAGISAYVELFPYDARQTYTRLNIFLESARVGRKPEEKIRIIETDSGPRPKLRITGSATLTNVRDWTFIACGANTILSFIYRSRLDGGHSCQGGMTAWDGSQTQRLCLAGERAGIIHKNCARILGAHPFPGQVGVLHDMKMFRMSSVEGFHAPNYNYCMGSRDNAMMVIKDSCFTMEYLMDSHLFDGTLDRLKAILIPFCPYVDEQIGEALKKYVANGGIVIAESLFGVKDHSLTQSWKRTPGGGLDKVFGLNTVDAMLFEENDSIILENGTRLESASDFRMVIQPEPGAHVIGQYADGEPAVVVNKYGKGATMFLGALMTTKYTWKSSSFRDLTRDFIMKHSGIRPIYMVEAEFGFEDTVGNVGVYPVTCDNESIDGVYIVNYNKETVKFRLGLDAGRICRNSFTDIITGKQYVLGEGDMREISVELDGHNALVLF